MHECVCEREGVCVYVCEGEGACVAVVVDGDLCVLLVHLCPCTFACPVRARMHVRVLVPCACASL